jgi:hypothetical protein
MGNREMVPRWDYCAKAAGGEPGGLDLHCGLVSLFLVPVGPFGLLSVLFDLLGVWNLFLWVVTTFSLFWTAIHVALVCQLILQNCWQ